MAETLDSLAGQGVQFKCSQKKKKKKKKRITMPFNSTSQTHLGLLGTYLILRYFDFDQHAKSCQQNISVWCILNFAVFQLQYCLI